MRDELSKAPTSPISIEKDLLPHHGEPIDPHAMARRDLQKVLPKRFYKAAAPLEQGGAHVLALDGRPTRTPAGKPLAVPTRPLAEAIAAEWEAQGEFIDPATMPLTRIVNSALDGVAQEIDAVRAEVVKYAGSDLLCYRAGDPASLVAEQSAAWDPVLDWARAQWGVRFVLAEGVMFVDQPAAALDAVRQAVDKVTAPLPLAGLHVMTTLTGSALLALAVHAGHLGVDAAWSIAHIDEDFQMRAWGMDADALARRERRWQDMQAAAQVAASG
jgi:chaperone required for assembly of F1-ATPase